jgi:uncharacterized protein YprB with RNaseH-like and TPR domain
MPAEDARTRERRARIARLKSMMDGVVSRQQSRLRETARHEPAPLYELPGETHETHHGPLHVVQQYLEPGHCHGRVPVRAALDADPELVARLALDPSLADVDPKKLLFIDTETTGLNGGTGTLPFLLGMAYFEDESLCVRQLFLPRPGAEGPMLHDFSKRCEEASAIVSYNGKAFDWPLLRTRFVMNRVPMPRVPPHLDLLHAVRRVYKKRLERVRLLHVEMNVLGMMREHDIDGAEIPGIYTQYLRGDIDPRMPVVIEHNANDLIALAAILGRIARDFADVREADDPRDHLGFAEVAERAKDAERARRFAEAALYGGGGREVAALAGLLAARVARRAGDIEGEGTALHHALTMLGKGGDLLAAEVHLALAKHHEHRTRDLDAALEHARHTVPAETATLRDKRVSRLEARRARRR